MSSAKGECIDDVPREGPTNGRLGRVKLEGCILGQGTKVHAKAELSRCVTQPAYEVQQGGQPLEKIKKIEERTGKKIDG